MAIKNVDAVFLGDWLKKTFARNDPYMKNRFRLIVLWKFAISCGYVVTNEAEATLERSLSKKIKGNRKVRLPLALDEFWAIHKLAGEKEMLWMQSAMEWMLITLQARNETVNFKFTDDRNGWLYHIRQKTSGETNMAFIRIKKEEEHQRIINIMKSHMMEGGFRTPYLFHYSPSSRSRAKLDSKPDWMFVTPDYFTKTFCDLRNETGLFDHLKARQKPTPHEIRGLGSRLYKEAGYPKEYIRALMSHTSEKTTELYLEGGIEALTDNDFIQVSANLKIADLK
jgi:integrase